MNSSEKLKHITPEILLAYGVNLLEGMGINYWLDCGTLLGVIRDSKLLSWEKDLDIGVMKSDISQSNITQIVDQAKKDGYEINVFESCISINKGDCIFDIKLFDLIDNSLIEKKLKPKNIISSAISFLINTLSSEYETNRKGRTGINRVFISLIKMLSKLIPRPFKVLLLKPLNFIYDNYLSIDISEAVPYKFFQDFEKLQFRGKLYNVPLKKEEYLSFRYGEKWMIPDKNWITDRDDGAYLYNKETIKRKTKKVSE